MSDPPRYYYAVAVGRKVGIYDTWDECKVQVENLKCAKFKKFVNLDEAKSFIITWAKNKALNACGKSIYDQVDQASCNKMEKKNSSSSSEANINDGTSKGICIKEEETGKKMFNYVHFLNRIRKCEEKFDSHINALNSMVSGLNKIRKELAELREACSDQISNEETISSEGNDLKTIQEFNSPKTSAESVSNAAEEAQKMIEEGLFSTEDFDLSEFTKCSVPAKRRRIRSSNSLKESSSEDEWKESDSDEDFKLLTDFSDIVKDPMENCGTNRKDLNFTVDKDGYVVVYTDGACKCNGKGQNSKAGIGIYFGEGNPLNLGRPLRGAPPSNSNAEIQAARIAIKIALQNNIKQLKIVTDSQYLLKSATEWLSIWKKNNWKRREKRPLKNKKELKKLDSVMSQISVRWEKVLGHSGVIGNERADQLANKGAALYVYPAKEDFNKSGKKRKS